jgi:hypothetical protein
MKYFTLQKIQVLHITFIAQFHLLWSRVQKVFEFTMCSSKNFVCFFKVITIFGNIQWALSSYLSTTNYAKFHSSKIIIPFMVDSFIYSLFFTISESMHFCLPKYWLVGWLPRWLLLVQIVHCMKSCFTFFLLWQFMFFLLLIFISCAFFELKINKSTT